MTLCVWLTLANPFSTSSLTLLPPPLSTGAASSPSAVGDARCVLHSSAGLLCRSDDRRSESVRAHWVVHDGWSVMGGVAGRNRRSGSSLRINRLRIACDAPIQRVRPAIRRIADDAPAFLGQAAFNIVFDFLRSHTTGLPVLDAQSDFMRARRAYRVAPAARASYRAPVAVTSRSSGDKREHRVFQPLLPKRTTGLEPATFGLGSRRSTN